jgi:hypothetical protein
LPFLLATKERYENTLKYSENLDNASVEDRVLQQRPKALCEIKEKLEEINAKIAIKMAELTPVGMDQSDISTNLKSLAPS